MADNKKISGFSEETNLTLISGIAGYRVGENGAPNYNVKISGDNLKESVLGDYEPTVTWNNIANKPNTFAPIIGTTATDALAGNTTTISTAQATAISNSLQKQASGLDTRVAFFGGDGQVGGSSGLTYTSDTLSIGNTSFAGTLQIYGNYLALTGDYESPKITFYVDNPDDANESYTQILEASSSATGNQKIILPSAAATTTGQVLSSSAVDGTKVTTSWVTPTTGGGEVDYTDFNVVTNKAVLSEESQPTYGHSEKYTASGTILNGQPVIYSYFNNLVRAISSSALPNQIELIGIALNNASDGDPVNVLTEGFCTARRLTTFEPTETGENVDHPMSDGFTSVNLSNVENGTYFDGPGSYSSGATSTVEWTIDGNNDERFMSLDFSDSETWAFEGGNSVIYDRLFFEVSFDGDEYFAFNWKWGLRVEDDLPGDSGSDDMFNSGDWDDVNDDGEYVNAGGSTLPRIKEWAETFKGDNNLIINFVSPVADPVFGPAGTPYKRVRANFISDGTSVASGWTSIMKATPTYSGDQPPVSVPINAAVNLSAANLTRSALVTEPGSSTVKIGRAISTDGTDDALMIRVIHNH